MSTSKSESERIAMLESLSDIGRKIEELTERAESLVLKYSIENQSFSFSDWFTWVETRATLKAVLPHLNELIENLSHEGKKTQQRESLTT